MAGKATVSFDQYNEVFKELTEAHKKPPTVKELQRKLGGGSTELLGKYRSMRLLEEEAAPQVLTLKPNLAKAIQVEMDDVRNLAVAALSETLRVEREQCKADFESIEVQNSERDRAYTEAMDKERDQTRRAIIQVEERDLEIDRLRVECTQHLEARRVAEVEREKAIAVSEAELAGIERERRSNDVVLTDLKADLKAERQARQQSDRELGACRQETAVLEQKNHFLQKENQRLQKCEEAAAEVPTLKAINQAQANQICDLKDAAKVMSDLELSLQGEIHRLRKDLGLLQRRKDEYKGRAEVAERMHLENLKAPEVG